MATNDDEEKLLRSAALQNSNTILLARKRAEQELLQAKEALEARTSELAASLSKIRATLESTNDGILVTDANGKITDCNKRFLSFWGISHELLFSKSHQEFQELSAEMLVNPEEFAANIRQIYKTWPQESFHVLEFKDGRTLERFSRIQIVGGKAIGRVWSYRDVTERKRSERALREQGEWFRVTLGSIGDGVITVDTGCRVTFLNPVAEMHTGWPMADAVGQPLATVMRIVDETKREILASPIDRALSEGKTVGLANHSILISRDGSEIPIEDSAAPIKDPSGRIIGAVMVFQDVSERRQKESALARLYEGEQQARGAAEEANKAKDHFLAVLSHELRTPLTPVIAILSSLEEDSTIPEALASDLEVIRRNVELEARLIDDLLDLTRISRGKLELHSERVQVARIIQNAVDMCVTEMAGKNLTLVREADADDQAMFADGIRVSQILWNLLKNAIKFTPPGGTITIRSSHVVVKRRKHVEIEVRDTGIGIDPSQMEKLFTAFEQGGRTVTRVFGGLGLGLAISKTIAELHGGSIRAASNGKGQGSTLTLTLPCNELGEEAEMLPDALKPGSQSTAEGRKLKILLVEDHADTAMILSRLLRKLGHTVFHAPTLASALVAAEREVAAGGIDIVMSDVGLPDGSGLELMRVLSFKFGLRGIAISGFGMDSDIEQSRAAGFIRHLTKPIDVKLLRRTIAEIAGTP